MTRRPTAVADPLEPSRHEQLSTSTTSLGVASAPRAAFEVTTLADVVDANDGVLSLREAIIEANALAGADTITFAEDIRGGTIALKFGALSVTDDVMVDGDPNDGGPGGIVIDGNYFSGLGPANQKAFDVTNSTFGIADVTVRDIGLIGIDATNAEIDTDRVLIERVGTLIAGGGGFGIRLTGGTLALDKSTIRDVGNGIRVDGTEAVIIDSTIGPSFSDYGVGILGSGDVLVRQSSIVGNGRVGGAGIELEGRLEIEDSTLGFNGSRLDDLTGGNAILIDGELLLVNSTIADTGTASDPFFDPATGAAVGVTAGSTASIVNSTITGTFIGDSDNLADQLVDGPSLYAGAGSTVRVANSIIDGSIVGTITSNGANTFRDAAVDGAVAGDQLGVPAEALFASTREIGNTGIRAGVLADNGGPTRTVALLDDPANPALDAADPADAPATDQRGFLRDATPDIGAFELDGTPVAPDTLPPLAEKVPLPDSEIVGAPLFLVGPSGDAEISFVDEYAAFQSSLGVYLVGPDGTIGATEWVFDRIEHSEPSDLASTMARPGGGPLSPGVAVLLSDLFAPEELTLGTGFGLFLAADGWALNDAAIFAGGRLEFRSGNDPASVTDTTPELVFIADNGHERLVLGDILHSIDAGSPNPLSNTLNPGGTGQVTSGLLDGAFTLAFEDKPLSHNSDRDFNDALFAVAAANAEATTTAATAAVELQGLVTEADAA